MKKSSWRLWLVNLALVLSLAVGWLVTRDARVLPESATDVAAMTYVLNQWVGADVALDPFEEQLFGSGRVLKRGYRLRELNDTAVPIGLLAVQTFGDRHAHHPPEYCYTGSGWEVSDRPAIPWLVPNGGTPASIVVEREANGGKRERELVIYWFTDGERFATSYLMRTIYDAWDRLRGKPRSWVLVRISQPVDGAPTEVAQQSLKVFSEAVQHQLWRARA
ncbi:MAG: exosortase C-terminal domain/associated protein EpsI [Pseudomonadota bacterium]